MRPDETRTLGLRTGVEIVSHFDRLHYAHVLAARHVPNLWADAEWDAEVLVRAEPAAREQPPRKLRAG